MVKLLTVMPYFDSLNFVGRAFFLNRYASAGSSGSETRRTNSVRVQSPVMMPVRTLRKSRTSAAAQHPTKIQ